MARTPLVHVVPARVLGASTEQDEGVAITFVLGLGTQALSEGDHLHVILTKGQADMLIQHIEHVYE